MATRASPESRTFERSGHPILAVSGRSARVSDLRQLWLDERTEAFSVSVRTVLRDAAARSEPDAGGTRFVLARALLDALRDYGRSLEPKSPDLKHVLLQYLLEQDGGGAPARSRSRGSKADQGDEQAAAAAVAPPWLTEVLAGAAGIAYRLAGGLANTGVSELVAAALRSGDVQHALFAPALDETARKRSFDRLRRDGKRVLAGQSPRPVEWAAALGRIEVIPPPGPVAESERHYVADRPLDSLERDVMGTAEDARALAEVICLRRPGPPLAVGLFGDWGSGKSTFMNLLEIAIDEIAAPATAVADGAAQSPFIGRAVHIRFNAWTYNDANLWASLASEFFQQLRWGGHRYADEAVFDQLVSAVAEHVARSEGDAAEKADEAVGARTRAVRLEAEIRAIERRREQREAGMLVAIGADLAAAALASNVRARQTLAALGHSLPPQRGAEDRAALGQRVAADMSALLRAPGQAAALWQTAKLLLARRPGGAVGWLFWALVVAVPVLLLVVLGGDTSPLAPLAPAAGALIALWRIAQPILERLRARRHKDQALILEEQQSLAEKRAGMADEERKAAAAVSAFAAAEAEAARFRGERPEQVLEFFLGRNRELHSLQDELGTVSRVRRAFEELNAIMSARDAEGRRRRGEALSAEDERLLARYVDAAGEDAGARAAYAFDRIVIYIDDLDRCRADQVVDVLEAVHLLLAFPLFVVVVGVDPRWLLNALRHYYATELGVAPGASADDADLHAVPREYLEKIFQIPVNLRPLSPGAGGTFADLVESIAGPREAVPPAGALEASADSPGPGDKRFEIGALELPAPPAAETLDQRTRRIAMLPQEVETMTALGPLAGSSPRAVKRLVNVYRFIRGLYRAQALDEFLHGRPNLRPGPRFPAVLFWLALDGGVPAEQVQRLRAAVAAMKNTRHLIADLRAPAKAPGGKRPNRIPATAWTALGAFWQQVPAHRRDGVAAAFEHVETALPGVEGFAALKAAMEETERFTFASLGASRGG